MKEIKLYKGEIALVDNEDFEYLNQFNWFAAKRGKNFYAARSISIDKNKTVVIYMHRQVLKAQKGLKTDHVDMCGLNNQKSNLRASTHAENMRNRVKPSSNTSGFKGVYWNKERGKWQAQITTNYKTVNLGRFNDKTEAIIAYNQAAILSFGKFARINEI